MPLRPKKEPPIEVTLEKSSTGTWSVSGSAKLKPSIQPWKRFWLLMGIVYLLMISGGFYLLMPSQESIERRMVYSITEEVKRYDGMAFAGESPRKIFESARSQGYSAWISQIRSRHRIGNEGDPGFEKIERDYREAVADLPVKQTIGVLICFAIWALPMGVLYAIGFVFERIKRGVSAFQK